MAGVLDTSDFGRLFWTACLCRRQLALPCTTWRCRRNPLNGCTPKSGRTKQPQFKALCYIVGNFLILSNPIWIHSSKPHLARLALNTCATCLLLTSFPQGLKVFSVTIPSCYCCRVVSPKRHLFLRWTLGMLLSKCRAISGGVLNVALV